MKDGRVLGVISDRDLGRFETGSMLEDVMTSHVVFAAPDTTVKRPASLLRGRVIGCLPVIDGKTLTGS
jgi:CBS domain-containing protein